MNLKTLVKAGGVDNLTEARYFAAAGAQMIGLNMDAVGGVDVIKAAQISQWLTGVSIVSEFENSSLGFIQEAVDNLKPAYIQLGDSYSAADCKSFVLPVLKKICFSDKLSGNELKETLNDFNVFAFILDFHDMKNSWELISQAGDVLKNAIRDICNEHKVILSMEFSEYNILEIIETLKPFGINLTGEKEIETGIKEYDKSEKILEAITND